VAALEPQFYAELLARLELEPGEWPQQERERWPEFRERLAGIFRGRTRQEWETIFEGSDACAAPVLGLAEAPGHPHAIARAAFTEIDGVVHPAPAPRFSRTAGGLRGGAPAPGEHTDALLAEAGFSSAAVDELRAAGAVA
jgi:alpha-methylacyl-CoA racemase